jgi:hypothetical protein
VGNRQRCQKSEHKAATDPAVYTDLEPDVLPLQGVNHALLAFSAALRVPPVALAAAFEPAQKDTCQRTQLRGAVAAVNDNDDTRTVDGKGWPTQH